MIDTFLMGLLSIYVLFVFMGLIVTIKENMKFDMLHFGLFCLILVFVYCVGLGVELIYCVITK